MISVQLMDLPRRYAYNPQWRIILFGFAFGAGLIVVRIHWVVSTVGILSVVFASLLMVRRLAFPKFLQLEEDSLLLPKGFFRTWITKIPYADIENGWETVGGAMRTLNLQVKGRTFEVNSIMLLDTASYIAVRDFLKSHLIPKERTVQPIEAGKYCFRCSYEGNGEIYDSNGEILWRFKTLEKRPHYPYGLFRLPDFVVYDKADKDLFRIKLERKWSLGQFVMLENGLPVCTVNQRSLLRNKFTLNFTSGQKWIFRMPLFTVNFGGWSEAGEKIRVRVRTHNIWYVLIDTKADSAQLAVALAFIHRERLRFN